MSTITPPSRPGSFGFLERHPWLGSVATVLFLVAVGVSTGGLIGTVLVRLVHALLGVVTGQQ
ncbi:hypothetical protein ABLE68_19035 [Nocardioides sp. CN2-186]|uniref:hypothetical protein n=1 Tax=Nocardioides tweenelious TaxID=3156607 RepID=UPI0032B4E76A